VPEPARGEAGPEVGLALTGIGGIADLVADIAQRGRGGRAGEPKDCDPGALTRRWNRIVPIVSSVT
jgi:hypothetical protein